MNIKKGNTYTVKRKRSPRAVRAFLSAAALLVILGASSLYLFAQWRAGYLSTNHTVTLDRLNKEIKALEAKSKEHLSLRATAESNVKIEQEVSSSLKERLATLEQENTQLKDDLEFYGSLLDPAQKKAGLRINKLNILKDKFTNKQSYNLVLAQVRGGDRFVSGKVSLQFKGVQNEETVTYEMNDVTTEKSASEKFRFKYFQVLNGELELPANFYPSAVRVQVEPSSKRIESIANNFEWKNIVQ